MSILRLDPLEQGLRILLVEDDEDDYVFIRDLLAEIGPPRHELEWTALYGEGLAAMRARRHDLYLLDYRLGARSGVDLLEESHLRDTGAPAVILTGVGDREIDERAMKAGATDFLTKDRLDAPLLERAIRYSVDGKRREAFQRFLSEATQVFNSSLEYGTTVGAAARVVVPVLADWSCIYLPAAEQRFRTAEVVHADPGRNQVASRLAEMAFDVTPSSPTRKALAEGGPVVVPELEKGDLPEVLTDPRSRALVEELEVSSAAVIPLPGKSGVLGVLVLASSDVHTRYREEDREFFRELGHRVAMALENARLYETVGEATRVRDELMRMVSHDLGNPLAAISIAAGRIEDRLRSVKDDEIARFAEMIRSASDSMERLLDDLLEVGRLETGHFGLRLEREVIGEILARVGERFAARAEAKSIEFSVAADGRLPEVVVDRERVLQVLSNLVNNALKFTPSDGSVRVEVGLEGGDVRISVSDTGPGVSEEEKPHLFDRFWQARRHRRAGAGLGLTISKEIVEAHGGRIWAESEEGRGSTFHLTLPTADISDL